MRAKDLRWRVCQALFPCGWEEPAHFKKHELAVLGDQFRAVSPKLLRVLEVEKLGFIAPSSDPSLTAKFFRKSFRCRRIQAEVADYILDRKSTRLNSSH